MFKRSSYLVSAAALAVVVSPTACYSPPTDAYKWTLLGNQFDADVKIVGYTADDQPIVPAPTGPVAWSGSSWSKQLATTGLPPGAIFSTDSKGNLYAYVPAFNGNSTMSTLPNGGAAWQAIGIDDAVYGFPTEAGDGTLFVLTAKGIVYRAPGETTWTAVPSNLPAGLAGTPTRAPMPGGVADHDGSVWYELGHAPSDHILHVSRSAAVLSNRTAAMENGTTYYIDGNGLHYMLSLGSAGGHGVVHTWDPQTNTVKPVSDGTCVKDKDGKVTCFGTDLAWSQIIARNGVIYALWEDQLMKFTPDSNTWEDVWDMGTPTAASPDNHIVSFTVSPRGQIYAGAQDYTGQYNPRDGSYSGGRFYSTFYRLDPN